MIVRSSPRLVEKKEQETNRKKRSVVATRASFKPTKFVNPHKYFIGGSHLFLVREIENKIVFCPGSLSECSIVTEVMFNPTKKITRIKLMNSHPFPTDFWKYIVERWRSFNRADSAEWADLIENFWDTYSTKLEKIKEMLYKCCIDRESGSGTGSDELENRVRDILASTPTAIGKLVYEKDHIYWSEFERNSQLTRLQGLNDDIFLEYSRKHGLLSYLPEEAQHTWNESLRKLSKLVMNPTSEWIDFPERDELLFNFSSNKFQRVKLKAYLYIKLESGNPVAYSILTYSQPEAIDLGEGEFDVKDLLPCHPYDLRQDETKVAAETDQFWAKFYADQDTEKRTSKKRGIGKKIPDEV